MPQKLGQNFLTDKNIARKITEASGLKPGDFVLEIGPGRGILTEELAKKAEKVLAVEIDKNLVILLKKKFKNCKNVKIAEGDALKIDLNRLICIFQNITRETSGVKYKVVSNIPYYITSFVIRLFLESDCPPDAMTLMVQKEVAERITARPGKMSVLSVAVQYYARPDILFHVGRENFDPVPEVDSAVIRISGIKNKKSKLNSKKFFRLVRAGFCAKRKTLANNLANSFHLDKKEVEEKIISLGFQPTIRAQELDVEGWKKFEDLFAAKEK